MHPTAVKIGEIALLAKSHFGLPGSSGEILPYGKVLDGPWPMDRRGRFGFDVEVLSGNLAGQTVMIASSSIINHPKRTRQLHTQITKARRDSDRQLRAQRLAEALARLGVKAQGWATARRAGIYFSNDDVDRVVALLDQLTDAGD